MENTDIQADSPASTWSSPPIVLEIEPHQVDIWRIKLDVSTQLLRVLEGMISTDEAERAARFHFPIHRDRFIAAHGCLRDILTRYLPLDSRSLSFSVNDYGKPSLSETFSEHALEFNLSHSGDFALVAVTLNRQVGVDVEYMREEVSRVEIARRYFSEREVSDFLSVPPEGQNVTFFNCWTRKEAYIKAHGLGLSLPLDSFDVSLIPGEPAILRATRPNPQEAVRWTLKHLEVHPNYAAAVAVKGSDLEFRLWNWDPR
jgi:4'-phosphopantetheinyl transferase